MEKKNVFLLCLFFFLFNIKNYVDGEKQWKHIFFVLFLFLSSFHKRKSMKSKVDGMDDIV